MPSVGCWLGDMAGLVSCTAVLGLDDIAPTKWGRPANDNLPKGSFSDDGKGDGCQASECAPSDI